MPSRKKTNFWLYLVGLVVIVVIVVLFVTRGEQPPPQPPASVDTQVQQLQTQSASDEVSVIEQDLQNTNLDQLDTELTDIEKDLGSL